MCIYSRTRNLHTYDLIHSSKEVHKTDFMTYKRWHYAKLTIIQKKSYGHKTDMVRSNGFCMAVKRVQEEGA